MDIRIIFMDLDGTLLRTDNSISERTLTALKGCKERGLKVVIATGRPRRSAERLVKLIEPDATITNGGALAIRDGGEIYKRLIPADTNDDILKRSARNSSVHKITTDTVHGYYANYQVREGVDLMWIDFLHGTVTDFSGDFRYEAFTTTLEIYDSGFARELEQSHPECGALHFSGGAWYRFAHRDATKFLAVQSVIDSYGLEPAQALSFGDDINDYEMIEGCGTGIAMANGIDEVKAIADFIAPSNDEDGVAEWLELNIL